MRSATTWSDRTLRRTAWGAALFLPAMYVVGGALLMTDAVHSPASGAELVGGLAIGSVVLSCPLVGLLILRRQPRNTIGWLLVAVGVAWGMAALAGNYATFGLLVAPGSVPGPDVAAAINEATWAPGIGIMGTFLILLFPDGHLPTPRWRPVAWLSATAIIGVTVVIPFFSGTMEEAPVPGLQNPLGVPAAQPVLRVLLAVLLPLIPLSFIACATGLVQRFRRSHGVERLQLKWLATAGAVVAFLYLCAMAGGVLTQTPAFTGDETLVVQIVQNVSITSFVLIPVAIGIAVLRHGLYGIDVVIINRALVYGSLTASLVCVYVGSVLLLQLVLSPLAHESRPGRGRFDPRRRSAVRPRPETDPDRRGQALLPQSLRRRPDARRLRVQASARAGPRGGRCRPACGRRRDRAAAARLALDPGGEPVSPRLARLAAATLFGVYALTVAVCLAVAVSGHGKRDDASILLAVVFALVGLLVARREPRNSVGWLLLTAAVAFGLQGPAEVLVRSSLGPPPKPPLGIPAGPGSYGCAAPGSSCRCCSRMVGCSLAGGGSCWRSIPPPWC